LGAAERELVDVIKRVRENWSKSKKELHRHERRDGLTDATAYIRSSTKFVKTLIETLLIVMVVIFFFLGSSGR